MTAHYSRRDFAFADTVFADDIDREIVESDIGRVRGREAVKQFFDGLAEQFSGHTIELRDTVAAGVAFGMIPAEALAGRG